MTSRPSMVTLLLGISTLLLTHQAEAQPTPNSFFPLPVCRVVDTRNAAGPTGGPALSGGASRSFPIGGQCGIPAEATAAALQFFTLQPTGTGYITVYPSDVSLTTAALMQFGFGQSAIVTNTANVGLSSTGALSVAVSATPVTVHVIIDVYGYFAPSQ